MNESSRHRVLLDPGALAEFTDERLLPNRAGQAELLSRRSARRYERLRQAAREVDRAWDAWMQQEDGDGPFEPVAEAIGKLRNALNQ